ncbi:hypothetical protein AWC10_26400 [Mycobacteroides immunogenum]|nr:hypothetical protein AWC10_26400 [Mycobacteroides immunogenum]
MSNKGRGVMETEGLGIVLFQAGYRDPADLDSELSRCEPVEDQSAVAARLLNRTEKVVSRPTARETDEQPEGAVTPPAVERDEDTGSTGVEGFSL